MEGDDMQQSTDSDSTESGCPLCEIEEVAPETAGTVSSESQLMRRIMVEELNKYGVLPDVQIYRSIARNYNKTFHKQRRRAGLPTERWTVPMVREHFEKHADVIPRRLLGGLIRRNEKLLRLVHTECEWHTKAATEQYLAREDDGPVVPPELVTSSQVKRVCDLGRQQVALLEKFRQFQKEDQVDAGADTLTRAVTIADDATQLNPTNLVAAAAVCTAAGCGDLPRATEIKF